jgi:hypothetical protein
MIWDGYPQPRTIDADLWVILLFFENGAGALPFIKKEKKERLQIILTESEADKPSSKTTQQEGSLEPGFGWTGSHRAPIITPTRSQQPQQRTDTILTRQRKQGIRTSYRKAKSASSKTLRSHQ